MESTPGRERIEARHHAWNLEELRIDIARLYRGCGCDKPSCVWMFRLREQRSRWSNFGQPPRVKHRDPIRRLCDHAHIVRDQHDGCPALVTKPLEQLKNLGLNRHIKRCGGLISNDELRLRTQSERDHYALAHSAGKFMRVSAKSAGVNTHLLKARDGLTPRLITTDHQMGLDCLYQLITDGA